MKKDEDWGYLFEAEQALCEVLAIKAELGVKTRQIYKNGEKDALKTLISDYKKLQKKLEIYLKRQMNDYDDLTAKSKESAKVIRKIEIMEQVVAHFKQRLETESEEYSKRLEMNIQSLVDDMLKTKRKVIVSPEFAVRVVDNYNDESKSEGQFAVVSFAYIGGIFKMLRSEEHLAGKEYPLVLDAPFSKLGAENRQNVVDIMPTFAPQVILFSKDDLHGAFPADKIGHVWTIVSNDEQNVSRVEEGYLWN